MIDNDFRLDDLKLIKVLLERKSPFLDDIRKVYDEVKGLLNCIYFHVIP